MTNLNNLIASEAQLSQARLHVERAFQRVDEQLIYIEDLDNNHRDTRTADRLLAGLLWILDLETHQLALVERRLPR